MLAVLGMVCFMICTEVDIYLEACAIGDNKNALDHNLSMKTEWRIIFQRGDFIRFDSKNDIVVGSIENIRDKISAQDNGSPVGLLIPVDNLKISGTLGTIGTGNARVGDNFL